MRYFSLPNNSLLPSVIGLGTGAYGSGITTDDSFRLLDEFAAAGGTLLDSAHIYAAWLPDGIGKSEKTVGQWVRKSGMGSKMIVSTKGGHFDLATPEISRVRPECIDRDIEESIERLQLDSIDLYYLHRDDPEIPVAELLDALQPHLRAGRLKAIGASNWSPERIELANREAKARGQTGFCCSSCSWSLAESDRKLQGNMGMYYVGDEALRFHRETEFPLIAYSAQAQGFFAQSWSWPELPNPTAKQQALMKIYFSKKNVERWQRAQMLAKMLGCSINAIALACVTSQEFPTAALIGPSRIEQLRESLAAADLKLLIEQVEFVESGTI
jgi:aryl-alcohol dehydrogenase-like predicted oxidoreductase